QREQPQAIADQHVMLCHDDCSPSLSWRTPKSLSRRADGPAPRGAVFVSERSPTRRRVCSAPAGPASTRLKPAGEEEEHPNRCAQPPAPSTRVSPQLRVSPG